MFYRYLIAVATLLSLLLAVACSSGDDGSDVDLSDYPYAVQEIERLESRDHFPTGQTYDDYTSNPPTSGPHTSNFAPWGISETALPKETAVHNMEHAGVVVWYNCNAQPALDADACTGLRNDLTQVVSQELSEGESVVLTPYTGMDSRIALTAWGYLDTFEEFDETRVTTFIDTFECNYDPENFC